MQKEYTALSGAAIVFTDTKEQLAECEAVLPDYYPEISRVLKCSVCTGVEDVSRSGDKVSVAGKADVKLVYLDADKRINIYSSLIKYTRVFSGAQAADDDTFFVQQTVSATEHRACAPRKCEIRADIAVKLICVRRESVNALTETGEPGAEVKSGQPSLFCPAAVKRLDFGFSETVELPAADSKITGALYSSQRLVFNSINVIKNKVMLKGCCELSARFVTENGGLTPEAAFSMPFTEIYGMAGAEENNDCRLCADGVCARVAVNEDGRSAQVFIGAQLRAMCGSEQSPRLPEDIYSVRDEVSIRRSPLSAITAITPVERSFSVSSDAECYDDTANGITAFFTDAPVCSLIPYNGRLRINGNVGVNFLVSCGDGNMALISRSCSFDEDAGLDFIGTGFIDCSAAITAASLRNGRIDYTVRLETTGCCIKGESLGIITDVEFEKSHDKNKTGEKIVLYYAHSGESIWNIAKENGCSAGRIREFNELEGETVEESRMLVLVK